MNILAARKYATPRNGPLTLEQTETRRLAYSIKSTASPLIDFDTAAREMAALITGPCWLVPTPRPEPAAVRPRSHRRPPSPRACAHSISRGQRYNHQTQVHSNA